MTELCFTSADGLRLTCRTWGEGPPILVLAGGPGMSADYMLPVGNELSKYRTVILPDQRGTRTSARPADPSGYDIDLYLDDLHRLRNELAIDNWDVLGHSWGGWLAEAYACAAPEAVRSMILVGGCGPGIDFLGPALERLRSRMLPEDIKAAGAANNAEYVARDPDGAASDGARVSMPLFFHDRAAGERFRDSQQGVISTAGVFSAVMNGLKTRDYDLRPTLKTLSIPTLVIHGDYDHIPTRYPRETAELLNGRFVELKDCGHFPWLESGQCFYTEVEGFLRGNC